MKTTVDIPAEMMERVQRALAAEGLEVREYVKAGEFRREIANRIGGAPGVPRLLQFDGPAPPPFKKWMAA